MSRRVLARAGATDEPQVRALRRRRGTICRHALAGCLATVAAFATPSLVLHGQQAVVGASPVPGLGAGAFARLDELARLRQSVSIGMVSSYDPSEGNDDGFSGTHSFIRKEGDGLVIAELTGPGVMYRFHTPTPTEDPIEFYFDGEAEPRLRLPMRELFTGTRAPFTAPLSVYGIGGYVTYVPIAYAKSLKIVVRAPLVQFIQINYARYASTAGIHSWSPAAAPDRDLVRARDVLGKARRNLSADIAPPGAAVVTHRVTRIVQPGIRTALLDTRTAFRGGGRIVGMRLSPAGAFAGKERAIQLRVYFDGDPRPAIDGPVGDIFGYAWGQPAAASLLVGSARDTNYMYFPMPYDRSARVELSMDAGRAPISVHAEFDIVRVPRRADEGRFHAWWHRENPTTIGKPFTYLHVEGRGHVVGVALQAQGIGTDGTPFFEGDDRVVIDGDTAVRGTGSEDSFNGGWYDVPGRWDRARSFALSGSLGYQNALARTGGFRLFLADAYPFAKRVDFTVEHGEDTTNSVLTDYAAVTYFYLVSASPSTDSPSGLPPAARAVRAVDRIALNPGWVSPVASFSLRNASLAKHSDRDVGRYLSLVADSERTDFGPHGMDLASSVTDAGRYRVSAQLVYGPAQGIVQLYDNDQPVGNPIDSWAAQRRKGELTYLATVDLSEGENVIRLKLVGRNKASTRLAMDVMRVVLERER